MAKKQSKKTGVVKSVLKSELEKTKLHQLGEPSLSQQILDTVSSTTELKNDFKQSVLLFTELNNFKDELQDYENTVSKLIGSITTYEQNPILKQFREVEVFYRDFNKSKKKVEKELYYRLTENELQDANNENKVLRKQLKKALKKIEKDKQLVDLAFAVIKNKNPKKPIKKAQKLSLNTNLSQSEIENLFRDLKPYFVSTLEQWQNLFSKDIKLFDSPIIANKEVTVIMIATIFKELEQRGIAQQWKSVIENSKAFKQSNKIITSTSLTDALRKKRKGYQPKRKSIIKLNYIKDIMLNYID